MSYLTGVYKIPCGRLQPTGLDQKPFFDYMFDAAMCSDIPNLRAAPKPMLPNTKGFTEAQIFDTYSRYVDQHGTQPAKDDLAKGKQVIIGLRIETNTRANQGQGLYDDRIALIWKDQASTKDDKDVPEVKHGKDFKANTDSSAQYEQSADVETITKRVLINGRYVQKTFRLATDMVDPEGNKVILRHIEGKDVNASGRASLGRLREGTYQFYLGKKHLGALALRPRDIQQLANRDINHDGNFDGQDVWHSANGDLMVDKGVHAMIIHIGSLNNTDSAGCQTLPPVEHQDFFAALKRQDNYYYVLVNLQ